MQLFWNFMFLKVKDKWKCYAIGLLDPFSNVPGFVAHGLFSRIDQFYLNLAIVCPENDW